MFAIFDYGLFDEHRTVKMQSLSTAGFFGIWHKQNIITHLNNPDSKKCNV